MKNPLPFCYDIHHIKAIILEADPSNLTDHGATKELTHVFGIGSTTNSLSLAPIRQRTR